MEPAAKVKTYSDGVVKSKLLPIDWYDFMWALQQTHLSEEDAIQLSLNQFVKMARGGPGKKPSLINRGTKWLMDHEPKVGIKKIKGQDLLWPEP